MVLNKKEKYLMNVIYGSASGKTGQCLITPLELLTRIPFKVKFTEEELPDVMNALSLDGYFEFEIADKKGEPIYLITLKEKGLAYERERRKERMKIYKRIALTIAFALLSWLVKEIITAIIK